MEWSIDIGIKIRETPARGKYFSLDHDAFTNCTAIHTYITVVPEVICILINLVNGYI